MRRLLPFVGAGVGLITICAAFTISPSAPKHTLLEEQQSERLAIAGIIGFALLASSLTWIGARLWNRKS